MSVKANNLTSLPFWTLRKALATKAESQNHFMEAPHAKHWNLDLTREDWKLLRQKAVQGLCKLPGSPHTFWEFLISLEAGTCSKRANCTPMGLVGGNCFSVQLNEEIRIYLFVFSSTEALLQRSKERKASPKTRADGRLGEKHQACFHLAFWHTLTLTCFCGLHTSPTSPKC